MLGSEEMIAIIINLSPGFMRCLKDAGLACCWAHHIWCGAGLDSGLAFAVFFFAFQYLRMVHESYIKEDASSEGSEEWAHHVNM